MSAPDLAACLARTGLFDGADLAALRTTRLAGLTNINHLVEQNGQRVVVRVPGDGTGEYIDRRAEAVAARIAADAGVNAEVLFFDPADGLMVTRFVDGAVTMDAARFASDLDAVARAAIAFRRLHTCGQRFAVDFGLFTMIDDYKRLLAVKGATLPDGYDDVQRSADVARHALAAHRVALVPCHCDPLCENFLDTGARIYIIDYEYSGNNDPMWDLGDLSVEGAFTAEQDDALLAAYFDGAVPATARARMVIHKAMCDLLWTLWGVIQHVNGNPADDFWAYAAGRFERCRALMATDVFASQLEVLR
jgi:thiamine kinase-like enzyme